MSCRRIDCIAKKLENKKISISKIIPDLSAGYDED
jgi:hypothetical protein